MSSPEKLAAAMQDLLDGREDKLHDAARIACPAALDWGEESYATELTELLQAVKQDSS